MINLRYHIVSITAVFLALGIGLVFGAAFVDRATVEVLRDNFNAVENQRDDLREDNALLRQRVDVATTADEELRTQALSQLVDGALADVPVLVVAVDGVDEAAVDALADAVTAAGARFAGVVWLTDRLVLDEQAEIDDLAEALQLGIADPERLRASLARRLGTLFADAGELSVAPTEEVPVEPTTSTTAPVPLPTPPLLEALLADGFLELDPPPVPPDGFALLPESGLRVVVVSGPGAVLEDPGLVVPLLDRVTEDVLPGTAGPVALAAQRGPDADARADEDFDPAAERVRFVGPIRATDGLRERLSTVDDLELFGGLVAAVLALEHGAQGQFGHYGLGDGAQSLVPPAPEPELG